MSTVVIPPASFSWPVRFTKPITLVSDGSANAALTILGLATDPLKQLFQLFDGFSNPIYTIANAGGDAILGDRRSAFTGGDIFNAVWQTMTAAADNVAANAAAFRLGHGAAQGAVFAYGVGAPGAAFPITSGVPALGWYWNLTGGAGARAYIVSGGVWTAIAGI